MAAFGFRKVRGEGQLVQGSYSAELAFQRWSWLPVEEDHWDLQSAPRKLAIAECLRQCSSDRILSVRSGLEITAPPHYRAATTRPGSQTLIMPGEGLVLTLLCS